MSHAPLVILSSSETSNQPLLPTRQTDSTKADDLLSVPLSRRSVNRSTKHQAKSPVWTRLIDLFCCLCVLTEFRSGKATVSAVASEEPSTLRCADQFRPFFIAVFINPHALPKSALHPSFHWALYLTLY